MGHPNESSLRAIPSDDAAVVATEAFTQAWDQIAHGRGHLLVVGAPGSGKSETLRSLESHAVRHDIRVRRVGANADHSAPPGPGGVPEPLVLVIVDDVHLLPPLELERWLESVSTSRARLIASIRPDEVVTAQGSLLSLCAGARKIVLEPWNEHEVEALLLQHPEVGERAHELIRASGGLPWLLRDRIELASTRPSGSAARSDVGTRSAMTLLDRHVLRLMRDLPDLAADLVLAIAAGYPSHGEPVAPALRGLSPDQVRSATERLWHSGLVTISGTMPDDVRDALVRHAPAHRLVPLLTALVDDLTAAGASLLDVARTFVRLGLRDPRLATTVALDARHHLATHPEVAAELYAAAVAAGGSVAELTALRAEALALSGDLAAASTALAGMTPESLSADGLRVAVTLALLGAQPRQATKLARWAQHGDVLDRSESARACAALAMLGTGDMRAASNLLARDSSSGPELVASLLPEMGKGVLLSLGDECHLALHTLVHVAASAPALHARELLPDLPSTMAALIALHSGDLAIAESVLARIGTEPSSVGMALASPNASRASAMRGWVSMLSGRYQEAHDHLAQIDPRVPRDQPWAWGLRLGLARRQDDVGRLAALWNQARGALVGFPVDLYSLLPLGEIGLAAARMHEPELAAPVWGEARALLADLGDPPLWAAPFHWYAVQAAVLTDRPDTLAPHARALVVAGRTNRVAATYAAAGRAWVAVLGRDVDASTVIDAAQALRAVGQPWEGSRLVGHAAARTSERKDAALLLECARDLLHPTGSDQAGVMASRPTASEIKAGVVVMSERELEVARLVMDNLTYQQIGEKLFLSARTVEHHMARIKQRSGAQSRSELLARLSITINAHEDAAGPSNASDLKRR